MLICEHFVLPINEENGHPKLLVEVKKYTHTSFLSSRALGTHGKTLILTHGVSLHKELWEPTLSRLFELQSYHPHHVCIREAWTIDCPNHGASAALNEYILTLGYLATFRDYTRAVGALLNSGLIDINTQDIIAIGHSAGSAALIGAADGWSRKQGKLPFRSLIMIDPPMMSAGLDEKYNHFNTEMAVAALRRPSRWSSREDAAQYLRKRQTFWDPRCLKLFLEYGLRESPADPGEVMLSCRSVQEAACYNVDEQEGSLEKLAQLCSVLPVHAILSEFDDLLPHPEIRDNVLDEIQGRKMASVTRMPGVGHFAPLENPEISALGIFRCLYRSQEPGSTHPEHDGFIGARL